MKKYVVFSPSSYEYSPEQNLLTHHTKDNQMWTGDVSTAKRFTYNEAHAIVIHLKAFFSNGYFDDLVIKEIDE